MEWLLAFAVAAFAAGWTAQVQEQKRRRGVVPEYVNKPCKA